MPYKIKPTPCILDDFEFYRVFEGRKVYRNNKLFYSWDELHGEVEVFTRQGWHLGALNAVVVEKKKVRKGRKSKY